MEVDLLSQGPFAFARHAASFQWEINHLLPTTMIVRATSERDVESNDGPSEAAQASLTVSLLSQEREALRTTSEAASNSDQVERDTLSPNDDHQAALPTLENIPISPLNTDGQGLSFQESIHGERRKRDALYEAIRSKESGATKNTNNTTTNLLLSREPCPVDRIKLRLEQQDAIIRDLVEQEKFLCRHYTIFRNADKEQTDLISIWLTCFGTLQGFLWVALALSLNSTREGVWYIFSIVTCCIGMVVSFFTVFQVRQARAAKKENIESWNAFLEDFTTTCRLNTSSIGLEE